MILHSYFARRFLAVFGGVFALFFMLFFLLDMVEQIRKFDSDSVRFVDILTLTALNVPQGVYQILPLITVLATLTLFLSLARSSELVVARASGRSAIRFLAAPVSMGLLIGVFAVAFFNPIVAATAKQYEAFAGQFTQSRSSVSSLSFEGLWLRQGSPSGQTVIRASQASLDGTELFGVTFLGFTPDGSPDYRIHGASAELTDMGWMIKDAKRWTFTSSNNPEREAQRFSEMWLPSTLTRDQIRDSFGTPASIPIWGLTTFIRQLEQAGFSARAHRVWLQMELALPLTMAAMVMIGAGFSMRHTRFGRRGVMVLSAIGLGFLMYFIRNFAQILGDNGQIPAYLAAWSPPVAAVLLSIGIILNFEDG